MDHHTIKETRFQFPGQTGYYRGKVRDVYFFDDRLIVVATDRISAFDHILPRPIPYKGQVLNQLAIHFLQATEDIVPNWLTATPDPNVTCGWLCDPYRVEMVIRGYLTGHAWRVYNSGQRKLCGVVLPEGMRENDPFPEPIITPATKAEEGHDEDISREEILERGLVPEVDYERMEQYTRSLFDKGTKMAARRGLILVDTKYEFGIRQGKIHLIDEIHTPDSSRYFYMDGYKERQARGERQQQLSKEFVREWLMSQGFQGLAGQEMPFMSQKFAEQISNRYIDLYEQLTGKRFKKPDDDVDPLQRIYENVMGYLADSR